MCFLAGSRYDRAAAAEAISRRYERIPPAMPRLLARVAADRAFAELVVQLRTLGWLDWHILQALANAALNDKLSREGLSRDVDRAQARTRELLETWDLDEDLEHPIQVSLDDMEFHRRTTIPLVADVYGLTLHQPTPDFDAIDRFLGDRCFYWTDDVEHADPFPLATELATRTLSQPRRRVTD